MYEARQRIGYVYPSLDLQHLPWVWAVPPRLRRPAGYEPLKGQDVSVWHYHHRKDRGRSDDLDLEPQPDTYPRLEDVIEYPASVSTFYARPGDSPVAGTSARAGKWASHDISIKPQISTAYLCHRESSAGAREMVFVTGASRSGTTMLSRVLGNHSQVLGLNGCCFGDL
jgi:hypothetical protein